MKLELALYISILKKKALTIFLIKYMIVNVELDEEMFATPYIFFSYLGG